MKVLLAVDQSPHSRAAARFLQRVPLPAGSVVHCLHVVELLHVPARWLSARAEQDLARLRAEATRQAERFVAGTAAGFSGRTKASVSVTEGFPGGEILEAIDRLKIDLAVVGTRGLSALQRFVLGSVAEEVVNYAASSVLIVRERPRRPPAAGLRVVVAVDESRGAAAALRFLRRLDVPSSSRITLVQVVGTPDLQLSPERSDLRRVVHEVVQAGRTRAQRLLEGLRRRMARSGLHVDSVIMEGRAAEGVVRAAKHCRADLIVIGSRGLVGVTRIILGSVSSKVVRAAPCSVLVVRERAGR
ncbi:universal stress protein [Candidatus Nitrospira bockiana]